MQKKMKSRLAFPIGFLVICVFSIQTTFASTQFYDCESKEKPSPIALSGGYSDELFVRTDQDLVGFNNKGKVWSYLMIEKKLNDHSVFKSVAPENPLQANNLNFSVPTTLLNGQKEGDIVVTQIISTSDQRVQPYHCQLHRFN